MNPIEVKPCKRAREYAEHEAHVWFPGGCLDGEDAQCPGFLRKKVEGATVYEVEITQTRHFVQIVRADSPEAALTEAFAVREDFAAVRWAQTSDPIVVHVVNVEVSP